MCSAGRPRGVVIVGAAGHGREVMDVVEDVARTGERLEVIGFVDDSPARPELIAARGVPLLGGFDDPRAQGAHYVVAVASAAARRSLAARAEAAGLGPVSLRHPSAVVGSRNLQGVGLVVFPLASYTTNVTIGNHVHVCRNVTIGHDCTVGDFVTLLPGATVSGDVTLGDDVTLGTGATLLQGVTIGAGTFVGAGAVVTRDLPGGVVAVGVPARVVRDVGDR